MAEALKVVHVEMGKHYYGGALQALHLMQELGKAGVSNVLACPTDSAIAQHAHDVVDRVHTIPFAGEHDVRLIWRLRKLIRRERPDLLHLHSRRGADVFGGIAARLENVPVVLSRRVDNPEPHWWAAAKYRLFDRVVAISDKIRNVLLSQGLAPEKLALACSGVDFDKYCQFPTDRSWFQREFSLPSGCATIGIVAQLIKRKGHRFLIDAMPEILKSQPNAQLLIFGKGGLAEEIQEHIDRLGLNERVRMVGFRDDLEKVLPYLDVLVHPATMEGLGNGLLQAACAGMPIVASNVGGLPEVVHHEVNGLLVPPGDSVAIAQAVCRLLSSESLRAEMGWRGRGHVRRHFSMDSMVAGNMAVYRELLNLSEHQLTAPSVDTDTHEERIEERRELQKHAA